MANFCLLEISAELLLVIFSYLEAPDLCRLRQTCRRLNELITAWNNVLLKNVDTVVTNQRNETFLARCSGKLSRLEQIRISRNWQRGRYMERCLLYSKTKFIPWLQLSKDYLWLSRGKYVNCYHRYKGSVKVRKPYYGFHGQSQSDVVNFKVKNNVMVSGCRDGSMWMKRIDNGKFVFDLASCHDSDINSVDVNTTGDLIASGCRDNYVCIWRVNDRTSGTILERTYRFQLPDRVWKVTMLDELPLLAVGTAGNEFDRSVLIFDLERQIPKFLKPNEPQSTSSCGISDLKWDGPHTLWSCGYDSCLTRWDTRTGDWEQRFYDPHATVLYCLDYDYNNTIIVGSQLHGRTLLCDTRMRFFQQLYFLRACKGWLRDSPVYSLAFDAEFLFLATDQTLGILDFSIYRDDAPDKNYKYSCNVDMFPPVYH